MPGETFVRDHLDDDDMERRAFTPTHYQLDPEPVAVIEAWGLGFSLGNVLKYLARAGRKPGVPALDDLRKARDYLDREIARLRALEQR